MANSFSASSLCPDLCSAVASVWWTSGFPGMRRSAVAQGRNRLFIFLQTNQAKPRAQVSFREIGIELGRLRESRNRLVPFLVSPRKFSENVMGAGIAGINLDLFQEFLLCTLRRIRPASGRENSNLPSRKWMPRALGSFWIMPSYSSWAGSHLPCISSASAFSL